jgi:hypothetical protein
MHWHRCAPLTAVACATGLAKADAFADLVALPLPINASTEREDCGFLALFAAESLVAAGGPRHTRLRGMRPASMPLATRCSFALAVINSHPNPRNLARHLESIVQAALARFLNAPVRQLARISPPPRNLNQ